MDVALLARSMGGLAAVLAMLAAALFVVRKFNIALPGRVGAVRGRIGIVERVTVDGKRSLLLVRRDDREHLLLVSPEGHVLIAEQDAPVPVAAMAAEVTLPSSIDLAPLADEDALSFAGLVAEADARDGDDVAIWLKPADLSMPVPANDRSDAVDVVDGRKLESAHHA